MKERNSAFEIMRLLAMQMIIWGHCMMAKAKKQKPYLGIIDCIGWGVGAFTVCAVNLYFLLTGYFLKSTNCRLNRIIAIWLKTIFYSFVIYMLYVCVTKSFSIKESISYLFPIITKKYWYMQTYIVGALISPFLAKGLEQLKDKQIAILIGILVSFFSIHQTFIKVRYTLDQTQGYGIIWACVMYIIGYWIRKNRESISKKPLWIYCSIYILTSMVIYASNYLIVKWNIAGGVSSRGNFYAYNSVTVLIQSIGLFCVFVKASSRKVTNKLINSLAAHSLAGYLISAHPVLLYSLWIECIHLNRYMENAFLYVTVSFLLSTLVLLICILIDKILEELLIKIKTTNNYRKIDRILCHIENIID